MAEQTDDVDVRISEEQKNKVRRLVAGWPGQDAEGAAEIMLMLGVHPSQRDDRDLSLRVVDSAPLNRARA